MDPQTAGLALQQSLGFAHFLAQADEVARGVLAVLLLMSVATWTLIVTKSIVAIVERRKSARFLDAFRSARTLAAFEDQVANSRADEPFSRLAGHAIGAHRHRTGRQLREGANRLDEAGAGAEFLARALRRAIDEDAARMESGLTMLASVGSTAPFIGLFGTVWGVYHALVNIGLSGQGTLDKVAGPVGEALIMTALGLAVAIPAVLAYNAIVRSNRLVLARLDGFAHDLHAVLTTGPLAGEPALVVAIPSASRGA